MAGLKKVILALLSVIAVGMGGNAILGASVSVPSAPGANYVLLSTSTGNYMAVSTSSLGITASGGTVNGSKWATSTDNVSIQPSSATGIIVTNSTTTNATTTSFFSTTASTTNFYSDVARIASSTIFSLNLLGNGTTTARNGFSLSDGCFSVKGTCVGGSSLAMSSISQSKWATSTGSSTSIIPNGGTSISVGIGTSTPGSRLSVGNIVNFSTATSSFYSSGGLDLADGCFAIDGTCVGGSTVSVTGASKWATSTDNARAIHPNGGLDISVGVGSSSPFAKLSIHANNLEASTTLFAVGSSTASATTTLFSIDNTGLASTTNLQVLATSTFHGVILGQSPVGTPGLPAYTFEGDTDTGMYRGAINDLRLSAGGFLGLALNSAGTVSQPTSGSHFRAGEGTEASPGLSFNIDSDTGLWVSNTNFMGFSAGGLEVMRIASSSSRGLNLGVGTTSPFAKLSIHANANELGSSRTLFAVASSTQSATTTLFRINNAGTVTLKDGGYLTSDGELNIYGGGDGGSVAIVGANAQTSGNAGGQVTFYGGDASAGNALGGYFEIQGGMGSGSGAGGDYTVYGGTGGATGRGGQMTFSAGPGGGTSGAGGDVVFVAGNASAGNSDGGNVSLETGSSTGTGANGSIRFISGGEKGRVTPNGFGIATTSPWAALSVSGKVAFDGLSASGVGDTYVCLSTDKELRTGATCAASTRKSKKISCHSLMLSQLSPA